MVDLLHSLSRVAATLSLLALTMCGTDDETVSPRWPDGGPPGTIDAAASRIDAAASRGDGGVGAIKPHVPYIASEWTRVFKPQGTRYLNDHTLVAGPDGTWHLYGITDSSAGQPSSERTLLHAVASDIFGPWRDEADVLTSDPAADETSLWAPYVFESLPGRWVMFYTSGPSLPPFDRVTRRADSSDLAQWTRRETTPAPQLRPPGGRDPYVMAVGGKWYLYSAGVDASLRGQIVLSTSSDLESWSDSIPVITDPIPNIGWGNLESPFVVLYQGYYYLFLTRTGDSAIDYVRTNVFRSLDPTHFEWAPIADIRAHAAEVVYRADFGYLLTSGGWTGNVGELNRGLSVAKLSWAVEDG